MGSDTAGNDPRYIDERIQNEALEAMIQYARENKIHKGVATILVRKDNDLHPRIAYAILSLESDPNLKKGEDGKGYNYFGIVMSKLAVMFATHSNSGSLDRPVKVGEVPWKGAIIFQPKGSKYTLYVGYSGGTELQDVAISKVGLKHLMSL